MLLSFIVPAHNEELELPATLCAIRRAAGGHPFEIIVVDDSSSDRTAAIAQEHGARVVSIERRHIAAARNAGARAARGDVFFFVDADTHIESAHVTDALAALQKGASGGSAWLRFDRAVPFWARLMFQIFSVLYFTSRLGAGAFLFTSRENFFAAGGFDEQFFAGEETYLSIALKEIWSLPNFANARDNFCAQAADASAPLRHASIPRNHFRRTACASFAEEARSLVRWETRAGTGLKKRNSQRKKFRIALARTPAEIARCYEVMRELRTHFTDRTKFVRQVQRQQRDGYLLAFVEDDGEVRAVAGYRFIEWLFSGRFLYVDDLVTRANDRSLATVQD